MGAKSGQSSSRAGVQRRALIFFAVLTVALFAGFAVAQGIGHPSVPDGDVAHVEDLPGEDGNISEEEFRRALVQQAAQGGLKGVPKEGSTRYEELRASALSALLDQVWIRGEAEELGLTATDKQVSEELEKIKEQNFPTPKSFEEFLETSKFTEEEVDRQVELQVLSGKIQQAITDDSPTPSNADIEEYYEAARDTQFTTKETRDARVIVNKDKAKVEEAKAELEADNSAANWKKVATQFSSDQTTKENGGLQQELSEELLATAGPLKKAIFDNPTGQLVGPVKYQGNYTLIEVVKLNPEKVQTLGEARASITAQLQQTFQERYFESFVTDFQSKWESRTFCAAGFEIERCANFKGDGRPAEADPACYEANPKGGRPAACPSPVTPIRPALPGSVSLLQPSGEQFVQRPVPYEEAETSEEGLIESLGE